MALAVADLAAAVPGRFIVDRRFTMQLAQAQEGSKKAAPRRDQPAIAWLLGIGGCEP
jgi:hypothetical protein